MWWMKTDDCSIRTGINSTDSISWINGTFSLFLIEMWWCVYEFMDKITWFTWEQIDFYTDITDSMKNNNKWIIFILCLHWFDNVIMWSLKSSHLHLLTQSDIYSHAQPATGRVLRRFATPSSITSQGDATRRKAHERPRGQQESQNFLKEAFSHPWRLLFTMSNCRCHRESWYCLCPEPRSTVSACLSLPPDSSG